MLQRRLFLLVPLAALLLAIAGCGGSGGASTENKDPADASPPSSIFFASAQISPEGDLKSSVDSAGEKILRGKDVGTEIEKALQKSLAKGDTGLDFEKDIKPWLGRRLGVSVTGVRSRNDADFSLVIATKDSDKAQKAIDKANKNDKAKEKKATYRDVEYTIDPNDHAATGVAEGWFVAGTQSGFKATVDTLKSKKSLADSQAYKNATGKVPTNGLALFYVDSPKALDAFARVGGTRAQLVVGQLRNLPQFTKLKPTAAALTVQDESIRVEAPSTGDKGAGDAVANLPSDAWIATAAPDAGKRIRAQLKAAENQSGGAAITQFKQLLQTQSGIDVDRDLLGWVGGLSVYTRGTSVRQFNATAVIDSTDPAASSAAVRKFGDLAKRSGRPVKPAKGGFQVTTQGDPTPITVSAQGDKVVIAYGTGAVERALNPSGKLSSSQAYKDASAALGGGKPSGLLSVPAALQFAQNLGRGNDPRFQRAKAYLEAFTSLAAGVSQSGGNTLGRVAVGLK
jgi:hypothetical protein